MKTYSITLLLLGTLLLTFSSCSGKKNNHVVATIGNEEIDASIVNRLVERDIYENLYRIYEIRLEATREYVGMMLLKRSADEKGISVDSVLASYINGHRLHDQSDEDLRRLLIDSLFVRYDANITLDEPVAPLIRTNQALTHTKGCLDSKIVVTEFSDFDCGLCSYMHKGYSELYRKYADRVKFVHSIFSAEVSPSARAAYAAGLQEKYWEMADTLFALPVAADSSTVMNIAMQMDIDFDQFVSDFSSSENVRLLSDNNAYLSSCGIQRTPTVLLNGHPLRRPDDLEYISTQIDKVLNEIH